MFRRPPRNFRGRRRRAASSGSSSGGEERDEERGVGSAPLRRPGPDPDGGAESEESERDRGGAASSSEGARAAAEPPLPPEEPARGGRAPLSFGSDEEEREGDKELFKIKKPSFNEVTFRIQKKEDPPSAEGGADESKMTELNSYFSAFVKNVWDPLSTSQTENLVQLCNKVFEKLVQSKSEYSRTKQDLINMVVLRMKKSIEEDVFIPLYPKR
ncbi:UNVERIFIED_CONTAM: hypothetical protein H355_008676 [Colinus virginianus]|nr:hypothetical protein H355_008676 [Colinus virginianus]